jgi:hypothetical protein
MHVQIKWPCSFIIKFIAEIPDLLYSNTQALKAHINAKATYMWIYSTTFKSTGSLRASMSLNFS